MTAKLSGEERNNFLFSLMVMSYRTSALMSMGQLKNPSTQKIEKDLDNAKLSIDILGMLQEKTRNNLTKDESELLDGILRELRLAYVKESTQAAAAPKSTEAKNSKAD